MDEIITDRLIQKSFRFHQYSRYEFIAPNIYIDGWQCECDLLAIRKSGFLDEIEMKRSVSDFNADFKKTKHIGYEYGNQGKSIYQNKHQLIESGDMPCNYFSFLVPRCMVDKIEVPDYCGLYCYQEGKFKDLNVREIKKAPKLHNRKHLTDQMKYQILIKIQHRFWAYSFEGDYDER